jgi:hypothetical protein
MIPKLIHQTWKTNDIPQGMGDPESWRRLNPDWGYTLWTDDMLLQFMHAHHPELVELYQSYPHGVQRADLARYCLLHAFGGIYADVDTRCLAPLDPLVREERVVLCEEPPHVHFHAHRRGIKTQYFNGTMAGPAGHPFWAKLIELCVRARHGATKDVLDSTGPLVLSAAVENWPRAEELSLHCCHLFAPDTLNRLLATRRKIVVPDCVLEPDGCSFDLNTFLILPDAPQHQHYKHMRNGIAQPPADYWCRRRLHDLRYLDQVEVDAVGGTMLFVHASVHRAGLQFPERPYRDLIETEAFCVAARELGVRALALPMLHIRHAPF